MLKGHTAHYTRVHPLYDTDFFPYVPLPKVENDPAGYQSSRLRVQLALEYIRQHPVEAILTDMRKIIWLYGWHKVPRSFANSSPMWDATENRVVDIPNPRPAIQDVIYTIYWVTVLVLFLWALWRTRSRAMHLLLVYALLLANALAVALTFADTRYRLEADPLIAVLAGFSAVEWGTYLWRQRADSSGPATVRGGVNHT